MGGKKSVLAQLSNEETLQKAFSKYDKDKSQSIEREELIQLASQLLSELVHHQEYGSHAIGAYFPSKQLKETSTFSELKKGPFWDFMAAHIADAMLAAVDTNNDGAISYEEWTAFDWSTFLEGEKKQETERLEKRGKALLGGWRIETIDSEERKGSASSLKCDFLVPDPVGAWDKMQGMTSSPFELGKIRDPDSATFSIMQLSINLQDAFASDKWMYTFDLTELSTTDVESGFFKLDGTYCCLNSRSYATNHSGRLQIGFKKLDEQVTRLLQNMLLHK